MASSDEDERRDEETREEPPAKKAFAAPTPGQWAAIKRQRHAASDWDNRPQGGRNDPSRHRERSRTSRVATSGSDRLNDAEGQSMDVDDTQNPVGNGRAASGGADRPAGTIASGGLVLHPRDHSITANGFRFKQTYLLVLGTTDTWTISGGDSSTLGEYKRLIVSMPMYTFDPADRDMYMNKHELGRLRETVKNGGFVARLGGIKGKIKLQGVGTPFIANATEAAATNSQVSMIIGVNEGLESAHDVTRLEITTPETGTLPTAVKLPTKQPWRDLQVMKMVSPGSTKVSNPTKVVAPPANLGWRKYNQVIGLEMSIPGSATPTTEVLLPAVADAFHRTDIHMASTLASWEHHPDFLFNLGRSKYTAAAEGTFAKSTANANISTDYFVKTSITSADGASSIALLGGTTADANLMEEDTVVFFNSSNNLKTTGHEVKTPHALPRWNIFPVPPPTLNDSLVQEVDVYVALTTEIEVNLSANLNSNRDFLTGRGLQYVMSTPNGQFQQVMGAHVGVTAL